MDSTQSMNIAPLNSLSPLHAEPMKIRRLIDFIEREKVVIAVECADDRILGVLRNRIKSGMAVDEENKKYIQMSL